MLWSELRKAIFFSKFNLLKLGIGDEVERLLKAIIFNNQIFAHQSRHNTTVSEVTHNSIMLKISCRIHLTLLFITIGNH